jgi:hypothetical protein
VGRGVICALGINNEIELMPELQKTELEWLLLNAGRELLSIVKRKPGIRYPLAIKFLKELKSTVFNFADSDIAKADYFENLKEKYRQEAVALSRKKNKEISAETVIKRRMSTIRDLIKQFKTTDKNPSRLKKELKDLKLILESNTLSDLKIERITENQAIDNDSYNDRLNKFCTNKYLGKFNEFYDTENDRVFRITMLHPNPTEAVVGADLIYEQYHPTKKLVRIVAIQYKMWDKGILYLNSSDSIKAQLTKMRQHFCRKNLCCDKNGNQFCKDQYRMSYCMAFLKPTDKLQNVKSPTTSGYHLPICRVSKVQTATSTGLKLELKSIKTQSLKTGAFEELFDAEMIGSRWIKITELEKFYQRSKVLEQGGKITLYTQCL